MKSGQWHGSILISVHGSRRAEQIMHVPHKAKASDAVYLHGFGDENCTCEATCWPHSGLTSTGTTCYDILYLFFFFTVFCLI